MNRHANTLDCTPSFSARQIDALAQRRAQAKLGWYTHAAIYACVTGGLALIGLWQGRYWHFAPALGWGLGLAIHGLRVFALGPGAGLRRKMVERERQHLQRTQTPGIAP